MNLIHNPKILIKRFSGAGYVPLASQLNVGELGVNYTDSKVYTKNQAGQVIDVSRMSNLSNIDDVNITSAQNDDLLKYNSSSSKWINSGFIDGGNF